MNAIEQNETLSYWIEHTTKFLVPDGKGSFTVNTDENTIYLLGRTTLQETQSHPVMRGRFEVGPIKKSELNKSHYEELVSNIFKWATIEQLKRI